MATTHVEQLFRNPNDWLLEGTYYFPLPPGAAVSQLTMWVDGVPIEAKLLGKDEARGIYDAIIAYVSGFGNDFRVAPTTTYISLVRKGKKFAIVDPATAARLDVGLKLKGIEPTDRLTPAGSWNSMVTHRVRVGAPDEIDAELLAWLRQAYDAA